jgi:hypothetical protein
MLDPLNSRQSNSLAETTEFAQRREGKCVKAIEGMGPQKAPSLADQKRCEQLVGLDHVADRNCASSNVKAMEQSISIRRLYSLDGFDIWI